MTRSNFCLGGGRGRGDLNPFAIANGIIEFVEKAPKALSTNAILQTIRHISLASSSPIFIVIKAVCWKKKRSIREEEEKEKRERGEEKNRGKEREKREEKGGRKENQTIFKNKKPGNWASGDPLFLETNPRKRKEKKEKKY